MSRPTPKRRRPALSDTWPNLTVARVAAMVPGGNRVTSIAAELNDSKTPNDVSAMGWNLGIALKSADPR